MTGASHSGFLSHTEEAGVCSGGDGNNWRLLKAEEHIYIVLGILHDEFVKKKKMDSRGLVRRPVQ